MKKENDHVLNDWVFSNNPEILLQNKEVSELKKDFTDHPENYKTPVRVEINEAVYDSRGKLLHDYRNITTTGHVEPVSMGNEFSIYSGIH